MAGRMAIVNSLPSSLVGLIENWVKDLNGPDETVQEDLSHTARNAASTISIWAELDDNLQQRLESAVESSERLANRVGSPERERLKGEAVLHLAALCERLRGVQPSAYARLLKLPW